jgi:anti-sigma B factor antagonist
MQPVNTFRCEVEKLPDDGDGNRVTCVTCHGRLVAANSAELKDVVKPLLASRDRILVDLADLDYLDSSGLGALVTLKVSAIQQGFRIPEFTNITPRIFELLRLTHLENIFTP